MKNSTKSIDKEEETENSRENFRIRLEARLKNDKLISAREQLNWSQKEVAIVLGISESIYGAIERIQFYPNKDLQKTIVNFYQTYKIHLN